MSAAQLCGSMLKPPLGISEPSLLAASEGPLREETADATHASYLQTLPLCIPAAGPRDERATDFLKQFRRSGNVEVGHDTRDSQAIKRWGDNGAVVTPLEFKRTATPCWKCKSLAYFCCVTQFSGRRSASGVYSKMRLERLDQVQLARTCTKREGFTSVSTSEPPSPSASFCGGWGGRDRGRSAAAPIAPGLAGAPVLCSGDARSPELCRPSAGNTRRRGQQRQAEPRRPRPGGRAGGLLLRGGCARDSIYVWARNLASVHKRLTGRVQLARV